MTILHHEQAHLGQVHSEPLNSISRQPVIKVLGLGGGGSNAVNRMIELDIRGVDFIAANTDRQTLETNLAPIKIQLGPKSTRGLGAGGDPTVGRAAAEESWKQIAAALHGADMVFLTAGMGGGTGSGSIPVAAKIARSLGAVTIAVVSTPFGFEMGRRQRNASESLRLLRPNTDTLIAIPNDRLLQVAPRDLPLDLAFRMADDVLRQAVQGITELITTPGLINVDFANIRHLMKLGGGALMSIGQGEGENKAITALEQALHHPLIENTSLENAAGVLVNFSSGKDLGLFEVQAALDLLQQRAGSQAEIVMGVIEDERLEDRVQVILIVTGLGVTRLETTRLEDILPGFQAAKRPSAIENSVPCNGVSLQQPSLHRKETAVTENGGAQELLQLAAANPHNLDLPAFLRSHKGK